MCVIAGYLGKEQAAPLLLEMLRREEGLAGGYYSGLSTIHEGVLYHAKVVGDVETLIRETEALRLPGTIGIAHSRTPGGGGRAWSHPFIDTPGKLAYIANGSRWLYEDRFNFDDEVQRLLALGYQFDSAQEGAVGKYPLLPDGRCLHYSDILCQAISADYAETPEGEDRLLRAAMNSYERLPGSVVGLCIHADRPDELVGVRHNKPMEMGRLADGSLVIASASLAFPEGVVSRFRMPALAGAQFRRNGEVVLRPFTCPDLIPVAPPPSALEVARVARESLCLEGISVRYFVDAFVALWPGDQLNEKEVLIFELLAQLVREGKVELREKRVPGMNGKGTVPETFVYPRTI